MGFSSKKQHPLPNFKAMIPWYLVVLPSDTNKYTCSRKITLVKIRFRKIKEKKTNGLRFLKKI